VDDAMSTTVRTGPSDRPAAAVPRPADFGGTCLIGECTFDAELLLPTSTYLGLAKEGSYLYGTWRDEDGNLLRAMRGVSGDTSTMRFVFVSSPGRQIERDEPAEAGMWQGPVTVTGSGGSASFTSTGGDRAPRFELRHEPDACTWTETGVLAVTGTSIGPAMHWFSTYDGGACYAASAKYRSSGELLGRRVEGFVGHEIHYFTPGHHWMTSPFAESREICWQQVANEYEDGSTIQATFAYGIDGWGFAMIHDEQGTFHHTTDVQAEATVRPNGPPETITYRFLDQSWTWRIDDQGERAPIMAGSPLIGADGTCTRDGDTRAVRLGMGNSDWWVDGRADAIVKRS
jgi:hypothetical protein